VEKVGGGGYMCLVQMQVHGIYGTAVSKLMGSTRRRCSDTACSCTNPLTALIHRDPPKHSPD